MWNVTTIEYKGHFIAVNPITGKVSVRIEGQTFQFAEMVKLKDWIDFVERSKTSSYPNRPETLA